MTGVGPTIGHPRPGYGLRVRFDRFTAADFSCPCGLAEDATGSGKTWALVLRYGRHRRDECPLPEIRAAGAREYAALEQSQNKRRRRK